MIVLQKGSQTGQACLVTQGTLLFVAGNRWLVSGFRLEFTLRITGMAIPLRFIAMPVMRLLGILNYSSSRSL